MVIKTLKIGMEITEIKKDLEIVINQLQIVLWLTITATVKQYIIKQETTWITQIFTKNNKMCNQNK